VPAYLFDTTALLAHYLDEPGAEDVQSILEDTDSTVHASSVSLTELARRLVALGEPVVEARRRALDYAELIDELITVDGALAIRAFELGASATGRVPLVDCLIAACAQVSEAVLVHRDPHFDALPGIESRRIGG
jgi:predicted nucleic acid-binding protein